MKTNAEKRKLNNEARMRHYYSHLNASRKMARNYYHQKKKLIKLIEKELK
jgi:hypothetical protein